MNTRLQMLLTYVCLLVACAVSVVVAEEKLDVSFEFGYNGVVPKSMRLVPVRVRIRNRLRNLSGRIEVLQPGTRGNEVTMVRSFRSPSPSTQAFTLFPRVEPSDGIDGFSLEARVVFDDKTLGTFNKSIHAKSDKRIVLTCGMNTLFQQNVDRRKRDKGVVHFVFTTANYQFVPLMPLNFPEHVYGYDSVHAIIINGTQSVRLSNRQKQAISEWVSGGGRLLIFHPVNAIPLNDWLVSFGITDTSRFIMKRSGIGLVAVRPFRTSRDLPFWLDESLKDEARSFFPEIVITRETDILLATRTPKESGAFDMLVTRGDGSTYGLPGAIWLLLIIVVYAGFIGPLDWWIIKKTGKHWLTWPMFAVGIIGFSIISYWYSGVVQSAPMTMVWCNVLDVKTHGEQSRGDGCFWLHSTGNFDFDMESEKNNSILGCRESSASDKSEAALVTIRNPDAKPSTIDCRIPVFSAKAFSVAWREKVPIAAIPLDDGFQLPPNLEVKKVFLASKAGLETLVPSDGNTAKKTGDTISWQQVFSEFKSIMVGVDDAFPTNDTMISYWLAVSFSSMDGRTYSTEESASLFMSEWEISLDRSEYLMAGNKVLLVFVAKPLNEVKVGRMVPRRIGVDCVRYFIPGKNSR